MQEQIGIQTSKKQIMMLMTNKCFLDSSILVEYNKGNKTNLFNHLLKAPSATCYIHEVVGSEFLFYYLVNNGNKSLSFLQSCKEMNKPFSQFHQYQTLQLCHFLANDYRLFTLGTHFLSAQNLLRNIQQIASHNSDFAVPCREEGIAFLTETE